MRIGVFDSGVGGLSFFRELDKNTHRSLEFIWAITLICHMVRSLKMKL